MIYAWRIVGSRPTRHRTSYFISPRLMLRGILGLHLRREFLIFSIVNLKKGSI